MKKMLSFLLASTMALSAIGGLVACGGDDSNGGDPNPNTITVWAPDASIATYESLITEFKAANPDYANFEYRVIAKDEGSIGGDMGTTPIKGAEVFFFASDQYAGMRHNNYLQPLTDEMATDVKTRDEATTVNFVTGNDEKIYAFPATNDNGYFLWYDSKFFTEDDVKSLDTMQQKAREGKKRILYDYNTAWYCPAFYIGAGCQFGYQDEALLHYRADLDTDAAKSVTKALFSYASAAKNTFTVAKVDGAQQVITTGTLSTGLAAQFETGESKTKDYDQFVAGFSGTWEYGSIQGAVSQALYSKVYNKLTETQKADVDAKMTQFKCTKLPTFTDGDGKTQQMGTFYGPKYCGVNRSKSEAKIKASLALANFFTGAHGQEARYDATGAGPSNKTVKAMEKVQNDIVLKAYDEQIATNKNLLQSYQSDAFWDESGIMNLSKDLWNRVIKSETEALSALSSLNNGLNT